MEYTWHGPVERWLMPPECLKRIERTKNRPIELLM